MKARGVLKGCFEGLFRSLLFGILRLKGSAKGLLSGSFEGLQVLLQVSSRVCISALLVALGRSIRVRAGASRSDFHGALKCVKLIHGFL